MPSVEHTVSGLCEPRYRLETHPLLLGYLENLEWTRRWARIPLLSHASWVGYLSTGILTSVPLSFIYVRACQLRIIDTNDILLLVVSIEDE
jgi:hypothetical protein